MTEPALRSRIEGTLHRQAELQIRSGEEGAMPGAAGNMVLSFPFSSEEPYLRSSWFDDPWVEVLGHADSECDLSRLNAGAPVLANHSRYEGAEGSPLASIGTTLRAWIENGRGYVEVKLSRREGMAGLLQDIADGLVRNVSVGYQILERTLIKSNGGAAPDEYRVTRWLPMEVSLVDIPADATVGLGRSADTTESAAPRYRVVAIPPAEGATTGDRSMPHETQAPAAVQPAATESAAERDAAIAAERQRGLDIREAVRLAGLDATLADDMIARGVSTDAARKAVLEKLAERSAAQGISSRADIVTIRDETETLRDMVAAAFLHRHNPANPLPEGAREFRGLSLLEVGRSLLERQGVSTRGMDKMQLATRTLQGNSDLANVVANVANKTLRNAYQQAPRTFTRWARQGSAPDFRTLTRVVLSDAPALEKVNENGEFRRGAMSDGKETYQLATYGKVVGITRQAIINDDLSAFTRVPELFGYSAAALESDTVYSILTTNAALSDTVALFESTTHKNYGTGAIAVAGLNTMRAAMRTKTTPQGVVMNLQPAFLIVPAALEATAQQFTSQAYIASASSSINPFAGTLEVVTEGRLDANSTTVWYAACAPGQIDTIEYCYLEGSEGVFIESRMGFDVDGVEIKARLDFAAKALDYRGLYKSTGA